MDDDQTSDYSSDIIDMRADVIVRVALLGAILGVIGWSLSELLNKYVIEALFCHNQSTTSLCLNSEVVSGNIALVIVAVVGIAGLVRLGVYRPMLVALAVVACLWSISGWLTGLTWYEALGWTALVYMVAYLAFAWLVRPRNFVVVIMSLLTVIVVTRIISTI